MHATNLKPLLRPRAPRLPPKPPSTITYKPGCACLSSAPCGVALRMTASVPHNNSVTGHAHNASLILIATRLIVWHFGQERKGNENMVVLILCETGIRRPKLLPQRGHTKLLSSDGELIMSATMFGSFSSQWICYACISSPLLVASVYYLSPTVRTDG